MKKSKFIILTMMFVLAFAFVIGPVSTAFADSGIKELDSSIYAEDSDNILANRVEAVVKLVGGVGGIGFVLAVLIIALFIIFGSIASNQVGTWWKAFFSCLAGAFVFFSAYLFAPAIAQLAFGG